MGLSPVSGVLYFAYGANMSIGRMTERCPSAHDLGVGVLPEHWLVFSGFSAGWRGPVANVEPHDGGLVHGRLFELSPSDIVALDRIEGHPRAYARQIRVARSSTLGEVEVHIYVRPRPMPVGEPPREYVRLLLQGYAELGLDPAAVEAAVRRCAGGAG